MRRYSDLEIENKRFGRQAGDPDVCITLLHDGTLDAFSTGEIRLIERCLHEEDEGELERYLNLERDLLSRELAETLTEELLSQASSRGFSDFGVEIASDPRPRGIFDPNRVRWEMALRQVFEQERLRKDRDLRRFLARQKLIHERNVKDLIHHASRASFIVDQHTMGPKNPNVEHIRAVARNQNIVPMDDGSPILIAANIYPGLMGAYCDAYDHGLVQRVGSDFLSETNESAHERPNIVIVDSETHSALLNVYGQKGWDHGANVTYRVGSLHGQILTTTWELLLTKPGIIFEDNKAHKGQWNSSRRAVTPKWNVISGECQVRASVILDHFQRLAA